LELQKHWASNQLDKGKVAMVARRKPRILIADHDQTFLDQLADRVLQLEMSVDFAEDAYTAIDLIKAERYDMIVLEVGMPIHNGLEILAIAKQVNPDVPVLMIAFSSTQDWAEQALNEGAFTYLLRPLGDISMFDRVLVEGLGTNGASRPAPKTANDFYLAAMKPELAKEKPADSFIKVSESKTVESQQPKPVFGSAPKTSESPMAKIFKKRKTARESTEDRFEQAFGSSPDGVIELSPEGQIMACNKMARDRLVKESRSQDRPISQFIRSMGSKTITETKRIDLTGHNAQLIVKPIIDSEGGRRTVLLIREKIEELVKTEPASLKPNTKIVAGDSPKIEFKNVTRKPIEEYPEEGFSLLLMVDRVKDVVRDEVDRFLSNNPIEWLNSVVSKEPEEVEVDPEMITAVHRRLSKINGSM
jgi:CheY-like chemotaxis protein